MTREKRTGHDADDLTADGVPLTFDQALDLAYNAYGSGDYIKAQKICDQILARVPDNPDALQLLAGVHSNKGEYTIACQFLQKAVKSSPDQGHLHNNLGVALTQSGKIPESIEHFEKAIELRPDFAKAYNNLAASLMKLNLQDRAVSACTKAISLKPDYKEAYNNLGLVYKRKRDLLSAVDAYRKAIEIDADYTNAINNLAMTLIDQGKIDTAEQYLNKLISENPNSAEINNNLGVLYNYRGNFEEARAQSQKAIDLNPRYVEAYNNLGTALMELARFDETQSAFEKAIELDPDCAQAHGNLALILLLKGQYTRGWSEHKWRWKDPACSTPKRPFKQKHWDGSNQGMGKLLIWTEQGVGDEAQFCSFIPHIISLGIDVVVECDRRLVPLLRRSFPNITIAGRTDIPHAILNDESITHQIPIASIPGVMELPLEKIVSQQPYLLPDLQKRDRLRDVYKQNDDVMLIGISYRSKNRQQGPQRSVDLDQWGEILKIPNTRFINLQYGDCTSDLNRARRMFDVEIIDDEKIDPIASLEDFSAQTAAMDLVISADNSTVHFAGAIGVEAWVMLPVVPDWRWGLKSRTTLWYRQMQLFRQQKAGQWQPVISNIAQKLKQLRKT
jgi:tetratricopeptide (TPR) repeat protein